MRPRAITIAILAMGGEGGGVLADWIVDLGEHSGFYAQSTSVPGVAQRTGSTIYYLELFPELAATACGAEPVLSLMPVPGEVDIVIASELMECGRAIQRGLVTSDRTTLIASSHRVYSMTEKSAGGDGRVESDAFVEAGREAARKFICRDFSRIAREAGSVISAALFGALAATAALPFTREQFSDAIRRSGVGVETSLRAFDAAFDGGEAMAEARAEQAVASTLAERIEREFPRASHAILHAAADRLADYQDESYAAEYLDRLVTIAKPDQGGYQLLCETARYLALWMSYEDAIRVADWKIRGERFERVRREARADAGQIVRIHDYLYPRVGEIADVLPAGLGEWLLASKWAAGVVGLFTRHGKIVETTSISGFLKLYGLARLRRTRRRSLRFAREQAAMAKWLDVVARLAGEDYELACAAAGCPRLRKGYGETYARGCRSFDAVMAALPGLRGVADGAATLRRWCEAALADDSGEKLAEALKQAPA